MFKNAALFYSLIAAMLTMPYQVGAAPAVGKIVKVSGSAKALNPAGNRTLRRGGDVYSKDTIKTGFGDIVSIIFSDSTRLAVGPRSIIKIVNFVPGPKGRAKVFAISAARGAFRFISGKSRKSAYKISAGSATIGIRGTAFDFAVKGRTSVLHYSGSIVVCVGGRCARLTNKCDVARQSGASVRKSKSSDLTAGAQRVNFPFVRGERRLPSSFRVSANPCDGARGPAGDVGPDGGDHDG